MDEITGPRWRGKIEQIRAAFATGGKAEADKFKKCLPAILPSGTFRKRASGELIQHSGIVHVDLDNLGAQVESWRDHIVADAHTLACFISPTGTGLKVFYRCDPTRPHAESFDAAERYVKKHFGLTADPACKDVARLCFLSWDPAAFSYFDSPPLPYAPATPVEFVPPEVLSAVRVDPLEIKPGDDYDQRADVPALLTAHGWTPCGREGWTRPGKTQDVSATWNHVPGRFYVFSSSADPFVANHTYRPWHVFALLKCGGDFKRAAMALAAEGYGTPSGKQVDAVCGSPAPTTSPAAPASVPLLDIAAPETANRELVNLLGDGFLRRGQTGLLNGPTGIGKSSFSMQAAFCWSVGRDFFGIRPQRPLRVLIVQSENDDADLAEMRDGILAALNLTSEERALAHGNVRVLRSFSAGTEWLREITPEVTTHTPDLLIVDPLFAFAGVDVAKDQPGLSLILRGGILPFSLKHNLGVLFVHHVNKPPTTNKDRSAYQAGDFAYSGSGHNELANFPRFVAVLRSLGSRSVFEFRIGKRWKRAGIADDGGNPVDRVLVKHGEHGIHWESATDDDLAASVEQDAQRGRSNKAGADEAGKIARAFFAIQKNDSAPLDKLARKVGTSARTLRRRFGKLHALHHGDDVLTINQSVVWLATDTTG